MSQAALAQVLRDLPQFENANLLVGSSTSDDAAVYKIDEDTALVQTVDFFTPIVDDPFTYGQIAATNSLSDVYAMGGKPVTALAIVGMPVDVVSNDIIHEILRGGAEKAKEAKCALAGGHSIKNPEPIYGLSVTGIVNPNRMITNAGAEPGDILVLTKPLGTGILTTAIKRGLVSGEIVDRAVDLMGRLNTPGARIAAEGLVKCATDVTGFGLLGHLRSLCASSGVTAHLSAADTPVIDDEIISLIEEEDCVPGGTRENLRTAEPDCEFDSSVTDAQKFLLADAQTSGGLLCCVPEAHLERVQEIFSEEETLCNEVIGRIGEPGDGPLISIS
ncbi:MAG: selenide, water dikinase SelD [Verrucomicrobiales bacterium]|nr:selenide, water dikinase SelD [Verrucomicrobiales bacterium]